MTLKTLFFSSFLVLSCLSAACQRDDPNRVLRGSYVPSPDGKAYFVLAEPKTCALLLDGKPWSGAPNAPMELAPGPHTLDCAGTNPPTTFDVRPKQTFRFEYWGP